MTVAELMKELRKLPKDAEVYNVKDWDDQDENGNFLDLHELEYVVDQAVFTETAMDFIEEHQVILDFSNQKKTPKINKDY